MQAYQSKIDRFLWIKKKVDYSRSMLERTLNKQKPHIVIFFIQVKRSKPQMPLL